VTAIIYVRSASLPPPVVGEEIELSTPGAGPGPSQRVLRLAGDLAGSACYGPWPPHLVLATEHRALLDGAASIWQHRGYRSPPPSLVQEEAIALLAEPALASQAVTRIQAAIEAVELWQ